jgi:hypothetical protein
VLFFGIKADVDQLRRTQCRVRRLGQKAGFDDGEAIIS